MVKQVGNLGWEFQEKKRGVDYYFRYYRGDVYQLTVSEAYCKIIAKALNPKDNQELYKGRIDTVKELREIMEEIEII